MPCSHEALADAQLRANLCRHDPRNPASADLDDEERELPAAPGCACDNCFYGRHLLAAALIEQRELHSDPPRSSGTG